MNNIKENIKLFRTPLISNPRFQTFLKCKRDALGKKTIDAKQRMGMNAFFLVIFCLSLISFFKYIKMLYLFVKKKMLYFYQT
jgi:hypothetical protein